MSEGGFRAHERLGEAELRGLVGRPLVPFFGGDDGDAPSGGPFGALEAEVPRGGGDAVEVSVRRFNPEGYFEAAEVVSAPASAASGAIQLDPAVLFASPPRVHNTGHSTSGGSHATPVGGSRPHKGGGLKVTPARRGGRPTHAPHTEAEGKRTRRRRRGGSDEHRGPASEPRNTRGGGRGGRGRGGGRGGRDAEPFAWSSFQTEAPDPDMLPMPSFDSPAGPVGRAGADYGRAAHEVEDGADEEHVPVPSDRAICVAGLPDALSLLDPALVSALKADSL